jgi:5-formyltetrahydrofolate cyclo-ligase
VQGKTALRAHVLKRRADLPEEQRAAAGEAFVAALAALVSSARRVAGYVAVGTEPPTAVVLATCRELLLPVLRSDGDLDWAVADELTRTTRGLLEPRGIRLGVDAIAGCDLVLVPALAVDRTGHRLGRGGGSYDRALPRATGRTIALVYDGELVDALPHEPHDQRVTAVVTPSLGLLEL